MAQSSRFAPQHLPAVRPPGLAQRALASRRCGAARRFLALAAPLGLLALGGFPALAIPVPGRPGPAKHEEPPPGPRPAEPPIQGFTACDSGAAGAYPCSAIDLLSFVPLSAMGGVLDVTNGNDVWGWTDPASGREYALMGMSNGVSFVDVSDPRAPVYLGRLPTAAVESIWRGIKVYRDHAFVVADRNPGHGMQVFDLRRLRDVVPGQPRTFDADARYLGVGSVHNLVLDEETGFAYLPGSDTCAGGLHIVDVRDPLHPVQAGCFAADGYTHDAQCVVYRGPDARYQGRELCFASNEDTLTIVDVTDKAAPRQVSRTTYAGVAYTHQGWLTEDHRHFLMDDEFDEMELHHNSRTYIWDVTNLEAPLQFATYTGPSGAIDHNQYVKGNLLFQANYRSGVRVLSLDRVADGELAELGFFDVVPEDDAPQFNGTWNVFPYFRSGIFVASGIEQGLYVFGLSRDRIAVPPVCTPSPRTLCLHGGRFAVSASWRNPFDGRGGRATVAPATELAGYLWFDDPANLELMVKLLDFGEHVLAFYGQLTNFHVALQVVDTVSGTIRTYRNGRNNCGGIDRHAFSDHDHDDGGHALPPGFPVDGAWSLPRPGRGIPAAIRLAPRRRGKAGGGGAGPRPAERGTCRGDDATLCLLADRFAIQLDWANQYDGSSGVGRPGTVSPLAGSFAFAEPANVEVLVKTLDFGGRVLVLWGSLSDLEYTLRVTDTIGGATNTYHNPPGTYCGGIDEHAF